MINTACKSSPYGDGPPVDLPLGVGALGVVVRIVDH